MAEHKKAAKKFASRAEAILTQNNISERPKGLADLMGEGGDTGLTVNRQDGKTADERENPQNKDNKDNKENPQNQQNPRVRLEVRIPEDLSEALRDYTHTQRTSKAQAVTDALRQFLEG